MPTIEAAQEWLAQAEALLYHKEYESAVLAAYEAAAAAARVPLYQRLVDPFNADEALWEFENLFVCRARHKRELGRISSKFCRAEEGRDGLSCQSIRKFRCPTN